MADSSVKVRPVDVNTKGVISDIVGYDRVVYENSTAEVRGNPVRLAEFAQWMEGFEASLDGFEFTELPKAKIAANSGIWNKGDRMMSIDAESVGGIPTTHDRRRLGFARHTLRDMGFEALRAVKYRNSDNRYILVFALRTTSTDNSAEAEEVIEVTPATPKPRRKTKAKAKPEAKKASKPRRKGKPAKAEPKVDPFI